MEELSKFCYSTTTTTTTTATPTSITTTTTTTSTTTITHFSNLLLSDFLFFLSFVFSHPLYFSYFIFFSPYILKLLSFLSPLFITTSLFLLAFLTVTPALLGKDDSPPQISESKTGFLLNAYQTVLNTLRSRLDDQADEFSPFEELEACILLVDDYPIHEVSKTKVIEIYDAQIVKFSSDQDSVAYNVEVINQVEVTEKKYDESTEFQEILQASGVCEVLIHNLGEVQNVSTHTKFDNVEEIEEKLSTYTGSETLTKICSANGGEYTTYKDLTRSGSSLRMCEELAAGIRSDNGGEHLSKANEDVKSLVVGLKNLEVCGSVRKEKEWKRTLACKLYEERQNVDGSEEGMDSLWEVYESDSGKKMKAKKKKELIKTVVAKEKSEIDRFYIDHEEDHEEDDHEDMDDHVQMCCLQALKFSTGKMNLGMGRLRISKAFKGIGWFKNASKRQKKSIN